MVSQTSVPDCAEAVAPQNSTNDITKEAILAATCLSYFYSAGGHAPRSEGDCSVYRGAYVEAIRFGPHVDLRDVFASNLRRVRHERGVTQDELAYEADISRSYLSQIEKGTFYVSLRIIGKLAECLNVEPAEFLMLPRKRRERPERGR